MDMRDRFNIARLYKTDTYTHPVRVHLMVTTKDINEPMCGSDPKPPGMFFTTTGKFDEANTLLNEIAHWIKRNDALDQRARHGDKWQNYALSFYRLAPGDPSYPSRFASFHLEDYVFADQNADRAGDFDGLMRMLDRDKLGLAMRTTLVRDLGIPLNGDGFVTWRNDLRVASHPDHRALSLNGAAPQPLAAMA